MKNLSDSKLLSEEARAEMKAGEQTIKDLVEARDNGTLREFEDGVEITNEYNLYSNKLKYALDNPEEPVQCQQHTLVYYHPILGCPICKPEPKDFWKIYK